MGSRCRAPDITTSRASGGCGPYEIQGYRCSQSMSQHLNLPIILLLRILLPQCSLLRLKHTNVGVSLPSSIPNKQHELDLIPTSLAAFKPRMRCTFDPIVLKFIY